MDQPNDICMNCGKCLQSIFHIKIYSNYQSFKIPTRPLTVHTYNIYNMLQKRTVYQQDAQSFAKKAKLSAQDLKDILSDSDSDWEFTIDNDRSSHENVTTVDSLSRPSNRSNNDNIRNQAMSRINDFENKFIVDQFPILQWNKDKPLAVNDQTKFGSTNVKSNVHASILNPGSLLKSISNNDKDLTDDNVHLAKEDNEIDEDYLDTDIDNEDIPNVIQVTDSDIEELHKSLQQDTIGNCDRIHDMATTNAASPSFDDSFESVDPITIDIPDIINETDLGVMHTQKKSDWGGKISLQTQRMPFNEIDDIAIKLPANTKIKVPIFLSKEQEYVIELAKKGHNIFYTGSAGTGKSVLLREMIKVLKKKYGYEKVAVTASTGLAACNIGGVTVHSFAGIGLGQGTSEQLYKKVRRSKKHVRRWEHISALVIDEISMLDGDLLDKLDYIARKIRKNSRPFGGVQVIFCGDFFQLPPVSKDPTNPTKFAFDSDAWKSGIKYTIMLQKVFRQQGDTKFIDMLNKMRLGEIDDETEREFKKLNRPLPDDDIIPAELYSTRNEVDRANSIRLNKLPGKIHHFNAIDGGSLDDVELKEKLLQNFLAPKHLELKVGAQVMMIKNIDATLVNGSLGKIIDFIDRDTYMFYETMIKNPDLSGGQLETIKKDPSMLKDMYNEENDLNGYDDVKIRQKLIKESYCKYEPEESHAPLGESIFDFLKDQQSGNKESRQNINRKKALLRELHSSSKQRKLPLVRFKTSDMSTRTVLVEPEDWAIEDENGKQLVSRVQIPLLLAWSLSIHKSQGQTLPRVKVDLKKVFEKGQAYVALSRAVSREGLQVLNFNKLRVGAHERVIEFYKTLVSAENAMRELSHQPDNENGQNETVKNGKLTFQHKLEYAPPLQHILNRKESSVRRASRSNSTNSSPAKKSESITDMLIRGKDKKKGKLELT